MIGIARVMLLPLLLVATAACEDPVEVEPIPEIAGEWAGIASAGFNNFWDLTLSIAVEPSGKIGGTGRLAPVVPRQGFEAHDFQIRWGAYGYPDVLVALAAPDRVDVHYGGRVTHADTIDGLMNGSGFNNVSVKLHRVVP